MASRLSESDIHRELEKLEAELKGLQASKDDMRPVISYVRSRIKRLEDSLKVMAYQRSKDVDPRQSHLPIGKGKAQ